ncbi:MAG: hypothetical protein N2322_04970, partial [Terrimicrobiaceae bacterium]|nr:hypothetical protein [Terrimicrobiaceae bacterium]
MKQFHWLLAAGAVSSLAAADSPHIPFGGEFAALAMSLRQKTIEQVQPQVVTSGQRLSTFGRYPWKTNIVTTVFWVG